MISTLSPLKCAWIYAIISIYSEDLDHIVLGYANYFILGLLAVITHSQLSVTQRKLWPISNIPEEDVTILDPQDWNKEQGNFQLFFSLLLVTRRSEAVVLRARLRLHNVCYSNGVVYSQWVRSTKASLRCFVTTVWLVLSRGLLFKTKIFSAFDHFIQCKSHRKLSFFFVKWTDLPGIRPIGLKSSLKWRAPLNIPSISNTLVRYHDKCMTLLTTSHIFRLNVVNKVFHDIPQDLWICH